MKTNASLGNLSSLAGLAGIDINNIAGGSDAIRPELYPDVLQSAPFALFLFKQVVYTKSVSRPQLFEKYWEDQRGWNLLDWLSFGSEDQVQADLKVQNPTRLLQLTKDQEAMAEDLQEHIGATFDKKSGVLTINSVMPDPVVSAHIATLSLNYLNDYITTYRTEKARREVNFLSKQVGIARQRYQTAEYNLSVYRDKNRSVYLNTSKIEEQRLQAEFILSQDLYNTLSKQAEMAKIKVQQETPVFKILEPAKIPLKKSGPKRSLLILGFALLGMIVGFIYAISRQNNVFRKMSKTSNNDKKRLDE